MGHLYDGHDPYEPPPPYSVRFAESPYDGEIAYADSCVGKLLSGVRARNLYKGATIMVMADHGESLGAHGEQTHGIFLYDETIHVPLLLKLPEDRLATRRILSRVGLVDVAPTLLEIAGIAIPRHVQGESLMPMIRRFSGDGGRGKLNADSRNSASPDPPVYSETDYPNRVFGWSSLLALRAGKYLFIQAPRRELYDEDVDPGDLHNMAGLSPAISDTLSVQLNDLQHRALGARAADSTKNLNAEQTKTLGALGYVANASADPEPAPRVEGADPKDKIEIANLMHSAMLDVEDGQYETAAPLLEKVLAEQPEMPVAQLQLGTAYSRTRKFEKAIPLLKLAVQEHPGFHPSENFLFIAHYELGLATFAAGDHQAAIPEFEFIVAHAPRSADAHFSLASVYAQAGRLADAMTQLQTALQLNPDHYSANLLRGRLLSQQGNAEAALPNLKKAAEVDPSSVEAHLFLADAYDQMNQATQAQHERSVANHLKASARN